MITGAAVFAVGFLVWLAGATGFNTGQFAGGIVLMIIGGAIFIASAVGVP